LNAFSHNGTAFVKVFLLLVVNHIKDLRRVPELDAFGALDVLIRHWLLASPLINILQTEHPH
jgi:hypothetical protein